MRIPAGDSSTAKDASKAWERTGEGLGRAADAQLSHESARALGEPLKCSCRLSIVSYSFGINMIKYIICKNNNNYFIFLLISLNVDVFD